MTGAFKLCGWWRIFLCVFGFSTALSESAFCKTFTWDDCVRLTAEHNPQLLASRAKILAAQAGTRAARSSMLPQFSLGGNARYNDQRSAQTTAGLQGNGDFEASLNLQQSIYSGGKNSGQLSVARSALEEAEADYATVNAEVTQALRTAFVEVLYGQGKVELLRAIRDRRAENLELVQLGYEGGLEHKGAVALSQASLYQAKSDVLQAQRALKAARQALVDTIGMDMESEGIVVESEFTTAPVPEEEDWDPIIKKTPEYKKAMAQKGAALAQVKTARSGFLPSLDLVGSAGRYGDENAFNNDRWSLGLQLSFPFWPGGRNLYEYKQAEAGLKQAEANVTTTAHAISSDLYQALVEFQNAVENVSVQEKYVEASELRAEIARQQYTTGLLSFDNWDIIENDLISSEKSMLESKRSAMLANAAWWRKIGKGVFQ